MRRFSMACAALGLAATALVATSPAQASYKVIRWDTTGVCQIHPGAINSIPSRVALGIDVRDVALEPRDRAVGQIRAMKRESW